MDPQKYQLELIKSLLRDSPNGLKIVKIAEKLHLGRNTASKYLDILLRSGEVEMKAFGMSKIYKLSDRRPLAGFTSLSSEKIILVDNSFRITEVNERFLSFSGLRREDIVGRFLKDIDLDIIKQPDILLNVGEALHGIEYMTEICVTRNEGEYYFNVKLIPLNTLIAPQVAIVYENISGRKKAENALKNSESRYRELVEDTTDLICRIRPDSTITFVNDTFERLWGLDKQEFIGRKLYDYLPGAAIEIIKDRFEKIINKNDFQMFDYLITGLGDDIWLRWMLRGLFDGNNQLVEYQVTAHDISSIKKTELMTKARGLPPALDENSACAGMYEYNCRTGEIYWSQGIEELYGLSKDRFPSPTEAWAYLVHPADKPLILRQVKKGPECDIYESVWQIAMPDGSTRWINRRTTHVKNEKGMPVTMTATNVAIPGSEQVQKILDRLKALPNANPDPVIEFYPVKGEVRY